MATSSPQSCMRASWAPFLGTICCTPDQARGHRHIPCVAGEQGPQTSKGQPSEHVALGSRQGKSHRMFQSKLFRGLPRLSPARENEPWIPKHKKEDPGLIFQFPLNLSPQMTLGCCGPDLGSGPLSIINFL